MAYLRHNIQLLPLLLDVNLEAILFLHFPGNVNTSLFQHLHWQHHVPSDCALFITLYNLLQATKHSSGILHSLTTLYGIFHMVHFYFWPSRLSLVYVMSTSLASAIVTGSCAHYELLLQHSIVTSGCYARLSVM